MLLPAMIAPRVKDGTVTVAYRRWAAHRVKVGSTFLITAGLIGVVSGRNHRQTEQDGRGQQPRILDPAVAGAD